MTWQQAETQIFITGEGVLKAKIEKKEEFNLLKSMPQDKSYLIRAFGAKSNRVTFMEEKKNIPSFSNEKFDQHIFAMKKTLIK